MTIYIDEIFTVNLLMDGVALWMTAKLAQRNLVWWRLLMAAMLGAMYAVLILFPGFIWMASNGMKLVCALLMVLVGYDRSNWRLYLKTLIYLYLVSFALGGATIAIMYFFGTSVVQTWSGIALVQVDFKIFWLLAGVILLLIFVTAMQKALRSQLECTMEVVTAVIQLREKRASVRLLVDSGNQLTDPTTGKSVIVVQAECLRVLLTADEYQKLQQSQYEIGSQFTDELLCMPSIAERIRLIPYRTVDYQGLLLGIRSDAIYIQSRNGYKKEGVVLALSPQHFTPDDSYQGVISSSLM